MNAGAVLVGAWSEWIDGQWRRSGKTINAFAEAIGMSHVTVGLWLDKPTKPQRDTVVKVARALGMDEVEALIAAGYRRAVEVEVPNRQYAERPRNVADNERRARLAERMRKLRQDMEAIERELSEEGHAGNA